MPTGDQSSLPPPSPWSECGSAPGTRNHVGTLTLHTQADRSAHRLTGNTRIRTTKLCFGMVLACSSTLLLLWEIMLEAPDWGWQTNAGGPNLQPVLLQHGHTYYVHITHGWFHAVMAEVNCCKRNCRAPKAQSIWLLQNESVNSYPKDWRRWQSYYPQS